MYLFQRCPNLQLQEQNCYNNSRISGNEQTTRHIWHGVFVTFVQKSIDYLTPIKQMENRNEHVQQIHCNSLSQNGLWHVCLPTVGMSTHLKIEALVRRDNVFHMNRPLEPHGRNSNHGQKGGKNGNLHNYALKQLNMCCSNQTINQLWTRGT